MENFDWFKGFILPYINFAIFLFLAFKFFKKPLNMMAQTRRDDYKKMFHDANKAKDEAVRQSEELKAKLKNLDHEINSQIEAAKKSAQADAEQSVVSANELAEHIKTEAKRIAEAEVQKAKDALREEILLTVKENVTAKLKQELVADKQKQLFLAKTKDLKNINFGEIAE